MLTSAVTSTSVVTGTVINQGTITADGTVQGGAYRYINPDVFINQGIVETFNGGSLQITSANWTNTATGTISKTDGGSLTLGNGSNVWVNEGEIITANSNLTLGGDWDNDGTITVTNSNLTLGGSFTLEDLGTINRTGGNVYLTANLDLSEQILTLDETTGDWTLAGGIITGGENSRKWRTAIICQQ